MDENPGNNKVLGLQSAVYVKVSYILVGVAAALGLLISILSGIGMGAPTAGGLVNLVGFAGWIMALIGWLALGRDFTVIENSHLRFISLLFVAMLVLGIVIGSALGASGLLWGIFSLLLRNATDPFDPKL